MGNVTVGITDATNIGEEPSGQLRKWREGMGKETVGVPRLQLAPDGFRTLGTEGIEKLMVGFFGTFRNTTAHAPKISWTMNEQDALDLLTMASFLHRRLDGAVRTPRVP